jgi:DNA topoisomerase-1
MAWDEPVKDEKCPDCGGILFRKNGRLKKIYCINEDCGYERKLTAKK